MSSQPRRIAPRVTSNGVPREFVRPLACFEIWQATLFACEGDMQADERVLGVMIPAPDVRRTIK